MQTKRIGYAVVLVTLLSTFATANLSQEGLVMIAPTTPFDNARIQDILENEATSIEGRLGYWRFRYNNVTILCITDEAANRMRLIASVAKTDELPPEALAACMSANFDRALDARYCTHEEQLWSAFIHPLREMTVGFFHSALDQVTSLVHNFGTSYSSGTLIFGSGSNPSDAEESSDDKPDDVP